MLSIVLVPMVYRDEKDQTGLALNMKEPWKHYTKWKKQFWVYAQKHWIVHFKVVTFMLVKFLNTGSPKEGTVNYAMIREVLMRWCLSWNQFVSLWKVLWALMGLEFILVTAGIDQRILGRRVNISSNQCSYVLSGLCIRKSSTRLLK